MQKIKDTIAQVLPGTDSITLSSTLLITATFLFPMLIHNQLVTGPIINAVLILSVLLLGPTPALTLGLIPSIIALSRGLLPVVLAPAVPFIMLSNAIYILVFAGLYQKNFALSITTASVAKFIFLAGSARLILPHLLASKELTQKAAFMLSLPQLVTAVIGGVIAFLIWKAVQRAN